MAWNTAQAVGPLPNISTTEKALGLGGTFAVTPVTTGILLVLISGVVLNSTAVGNGVTITGRYGTGGTAPGVGSITGLGNQFSVPQHFIASTTAGQQGFSLHDVLPGFSIGATVWFDLSIVAVTAGGATVKDVQFSVIEIAHG